MRLRVWDFCSGAGGFSCGFQMASKGHHYVAVDTNATRIGTYSDNIENSETIMADILHFDTSTMGKADVIVGSPPCPGFSGMNVKGKRDRDPAIINAYLRIVDVSRPRFWVMEESPFAADFVRWPRFLRACDFGLYHERRRLFAGNYPDVKPVKTCRVIHPTPVAQEEKAFNHNMRHRGDARSCCQWFGRRLHTWELQVLMGFPPEYKFRGDYKERCIQIGNAVCPPVSKAIFNQMLCHWNEKSLLDIAAGLK